MSRGTYRCAFLIGPEAIELRSVPDTPPGPGELLLAIDTATTCGTDVKVYRRGGHPRMLTAPCPFGHEIAGTILEIGNGVTGWSAGDPVVVANSAPCGACGPCGAGRENLCEDLHYLNGAFAERLLIPERFVQRSVYPLPTPVAPQMGALAEPLACVVHGFERMRLPRDCDVLILGGGPIGLMFVFLLAAGGHRVVLADPHSDRIQIALSLGADAGERIRNPERPLADAGQLALAASGFDAAVDATGAPPAWRAAIAAVKPGGIVNLFGGCAPGTEIPLDTHRTHYSELTLMGTYHHRPSTFRRALEILANEGGALSRLISYDCSLAEVETALQAMIERRAVKVAIRPGEPNAI